MFILSATRDDGVVIQMAGSTKTHLEQIAQSLYPGRLSEIEIKEIDQAKDWSHSDWDDEDAA